MSLQHVLATAKKLGIPVVITNEAGEASQVVMPFEDFAAMVGSVTPVARKPRISPVVDEEEDLEQVLSAIDFEPSQEPPMRPPVSPSGPTSPISSSDDKFYLEPIEDKEDLNF